MNSEVVLYGYFRSGSSWRVRAALNFKGISYETKTIDLVKGVQKEEAYKSMNPQMMLPTLFIGDDFKMIQSLAIIDYLEEAYPDLPSLYPPASDAKTRYQVRAIAQMIACDIHPPQNVGILAKVAGPDMAKREEFARWVIEKGYDALEKMLAETSGKYCVGDQLTIADICLVPMTFNAFRFNVPVAEKYPTINRLYNFLTKEEPCIRDTHPRTQPDCPADVAASLTY